MWKGRDKIARLAAINGLKHEGFNSVDLERYIKSSRLAWLGRISSEGLSPWKAFISNLIEDFGGFFRFSCNCDVEDCEINSTFYKELLQRWVEFKTAYSTKPHVSHKIIGNNRDIKIDNKTIYYPNYVKTGILLINHLQLNKNNIESCNSAKGKGLKHTNVLVWSGVFTVIPALLNNLDVTKEMRNVY